MKKKYNTALNYKQSPLPFQGQKRNFLKDFTQALKKFPHDAIYVDLFGGSGLLSRTVKDTYPTSTVVYNDFDNYSERLNHIGQTNDLLSAIRAVLTPQTNKQRLPLFDKDKVLKIIKKHTEEERFIDYVTLSSSLLFSGKYATSYEELEKQTMYNRVRKSNIPECVSYLEGLEVVKEDYKQLYLNYKDTKNVVFLLDPPYLSTDTKSYNNGYWELEDYLDVMDVLSADRYFYFTSNKSNIVELCEWFGKKFNANPFEGSNKMSVTNSVNHSAKYEDIMLFK